VGVYRRGQTWWIRWTDEHGAICRRSAQTRDRRIAQAVLAAERAGVERRRHGMVGRSPTAARRDVEHYVWAVEAQMRARGLAPKHVQTTVGALRRMVRWCGWRSPADVTAESLAEYIAVRLAGRAPQTLAAYRAAACAMVAAMRAEGALDHDPIEGVFASAEGRAGRAARNARRRRWPLSEHQVGQLLACPAPDGYTLPLWRHRMLVYRVTLALGLRRGELAALQRRHLHLELARPYAEVPAHLAKSGRARLLHMDAALAALLLERVGGMDWSARPFAPVPLARTLRLDCERAGIEFDSEQVIDLHALRVTCCTRLAMAGWPLRATQEYMGHASYQTTVAHYALVGVTQMELMAERLPALPGAVRPRDDGMADGLC